MYSCFGGKASLIFDHGLGFETKSSQKVNRKTMKDEKRYNFYYLFRYSVYLKLDFSILSKKKIGWKR